MESTRQSVSFPKKFIRVKIVAVGSAGCGKSCLIKRYCEGKFVSKYISTIGVDFGVHQVNMLGKEVRVNFWDLSGNPEFFEIRNEFYKDTHGIMAVFDVASRKSFDQVEVFLKEAERFGATGARVFIMGNKIDQKKRLVSDQEVREWAESRNFKYFETSALSAEGVGEAFERMFQSVVELSVDRET